MINRTQDILDNPHLLMFYAKKNCRICHGRGVKNMQIMNQFSGQWEDKKLLCDCVRKAIKKESKEIEQASQTAMAS